MAGPKLILMGLMLWGAAVAALADPVRPDPAEPPKDSVTMTDTEIKLPGVTINRETREVRIEATACLETGILEYVVCRPNTFEHEAIFTTDAKPELVHAALLLTGLKPTPQLRGLTDLWWDKALKQKESRVKIEVEWEDQGIKKRVNLSSLLRSREGTQGEQGEKDPAKKKAEVRDAWVFAGSFLQTNPKTGQRVYAGNLSGILVGIWPDPSTVIQYGIASGNPYDGKDLGMEINEELIPKLDTKVNLVFSRFEPLQANPLKKEQPEPSDKN